jgi:hypothetical protein
MHWCSLNCSINLPWRGIEVQFIPHLDLYSWCEVKPNVRYYWSWSLIRKWWCRWICGTLQTKNWPSNCWTCTHGIPLSKVIEIPFFLDVIVHSGLMVCQFSSQKQRGPFSGIFWCHELNWREAWNYKHPPPFDKFELLYCYGVASLTIVVRKVLWKSGSLMLQLSHWVAGASRAINWDCFQMLCGAGGHPCHNMSLLPLSWSTLG